MKRWIIGLLALGLVAAIGCTEVDVLSGVEPEGIRVTGSGKVTATPDIARVRLGVETFDRDVETAVAENNRRADAIIEALKALGIEEKDIQTTSFSISPQRDFRGEPPYPIVGFTVRNVIAVKVREIESVGTALQKAIDAGANNVEGVAFDVDDPTPLRAEARTKAIEDAKSRAEALAEAAGVRVGKAVRITELSVSIPPVFRGGFDEAVGAVEVPVQPGELEISVTVEVLFEIAS